MNFENEIRTMKELGMLQGSDKMMGELISEIHELKEKLHLMSVIKAAEGIAEITEQYSLEGTIITLKPDQTFGETLLSADISFNVEPKNYELEDIEIFILGYLSNIRFDKPFIEDNASYYFKCKDKQFTLDNITFKDKFIGELVDRDTYIQYHEQLLRNTLPYNSNEVSTIKI